MKKNRTWYNAQCWALDCFFKEEDDDWNIGFMITLKGLGEFRMSYKPAASRGTGKPKNNDDNSFRLFINLHLFKK
ncbi:MAG: hypothetical protein R2875_06245 [Desulfobacterales bacterium]